MRGRWAPPVKHPIKRPVSGDGGGLRQKRRRDPRVEASLPVELAGASGTMHNVSASGIFLETDSQYAVGSPVSVALNLDLPWGRMMFRCDGRIVRVEPHDGRVGVAVQFTDRTADACPPARKSRPRRRRS
jgi:hypothetical protein